MFCVHGVCTVRTRLANEAYTRTVWPITLVAVFRPLLLRSCWNFIAPPSAEFLRSALRVWGLRMEITVQYRGYSYDYDIDDDGDVQKIWHNIRRPDGTIISYPDPVLPSWYTSLSPYRHATREQFERCVDEIIFVDFCA